MFARLERYVFPALVALALWAAVLVAVPTVAQAQVARAQEKAPSNEADTLAAAERRVVVVDPGDTLWSISSKKLGPDAAPWRIARGVERLYVLNREQIGPDPSLVVAGQQLVLPERLVRPATAERSARSATGAAPTRNKTAEAAKAAKAAKAAEAGPKGQLPKSTTREAPREAPDGAATKAPMPAARPLASDDPAPAPANPLLRTVRSAADAAAIAATAVAGFFAEFRADGRRMLGLGIMLGTLVVAALMAWKLPVRRTLRGDTERWGIPTGYYTSEATRHIAPFAYHPGSLGERDSQYILRTTLRTKASEEASSSGGAGTETPNGNASAASRIRKAWGAASRGRNRRHAREARRARAVPRSGLALGAHSPDVRRASQQARAHMRPRRLRPQRGIPQRAIARRPRSLAAADKKAGERP